MTSIPWTPDDDDARRLLNDRIDSYEVDPAAMSWWERVLQWLNDALLLNVDASGAGSVIIQVFLVLAVVILVILLIRFFRPSVSSVTQAEAQLVDPSISAAQYLDQARQLLASQKLDQAYLQAYRAMVRSTAVRELVEVTPATTATVFGWSLGSVLPSHRIPIHEASEQFNEISYGGGVPTREATSAMINLAQTIAVAQPTATHPHDNPARLMPR